MIKLPRPPRPTEIKDGRLKMGQVKRDTVEEIIYNMKLQAEWDSKNLSRIQCFVCY